MAVKFGATRVPDPTVKTTAEHLDVLGNKKILLIVPKANRKSIKGLHEVGGWFQSFGVETENIESDIYDILGDELTSWFSQLDRKLYAFSMSGGEENAAWQTALVYYIAEYWDTRYRGLDSLHFVANIDGKPCFRKNWTSNR